jgi:hypothetical protein
MLILYQTQAGCSQQLIILYICSYTPLVTRRQCYGDKGLTELITICKSVEHSNSKCPMLCLTYMYLVNYVQGKIIIT